MNKILVIATLSVLSTVVGLKLILQYNDKSFEQPKAKQSIQLPLSKVEVADTPEKQAQGLMDRDTLCDTCGMIFVFEREQTLSFWMKNTRIPLDILFIQTDGTVVTVHENTTPFQTNPTYPSSKPARYSLEVNAGYAKKYNIAVGSKLDVQYLLGVSR
jgi:uncharacterized protein